MSRYLIIINSLFACIMLAVFLIIAVLLGKAAFVKQGLTHETVDMLVDSGMSQQQSKTEADLLEYRKIVITTDINAISAQRVINGLLLLDAKDDSGPIDLYIKTMGGDMDAAFAVIDVMNSIKAPVNTHATGSADSAGAMILAAGTGTRYAHAYSSIMFHAGLYDDGGEYSQDRLDNARLKKFWEEHSKMPKDWITTKEDLEFFLSPEEALKFKLIDRIAGGN